MGDLSANIYTLDAAYKPFPDYAVWASKTRVETERWNRYKKSLEQIAKRAAALDTRAIEGLLEEVTLKKTH